ncbi:MAG TPA: diguanylate cyclase, partial [Candidatus Baltobacteraceae bacterium]|nr:diguanylate cyclase [Candidatus Baltobacteraceae bacterium]
MKTLEQRPHLRDSLGLIVTALSAVGLALVLWQIAKLNHEAGLSAASMARERMAVTMSGRMVDSMRSLRLYQRALALGETPAAQTVLKARVSGQIGGILRDFRTGDAASIAPTDGADSIAKKWGVAKAVRGWPAVDAVSDVVYAMETALSGMEDASGLTYDPSVIAQNLADVRIIEMPIAISTVGRIRTLSTLALKNGNLTLEERLRSSNSVNALRTVTDLSNDHIPAVSQQLGLLIPEHAAEYGRLPGLANRLYHQADAYARVISKEILLKTVPSIRLETVTASSQALDQSAASVFNAFGTALDQSLERRGEIERLRNRYYYMAFVLGAVLLVGIMMVLAQVVARRDRSLLRLSQKEAARLTAELARQRAEEALRLSEAQFRAVFDGAAIGIAVLDRSGSLVDANDVFRSMFGDSISTALAGHEDELAALLSGERETFEFEQHVSFTAEHEVWTDATLSIVHGPPEAPLFAIAMFRDKTELKHSERRMQHDKLHDALTGLPNRQLFEEHLRRRFDEATALLDSFFAVLFIDLEHFKDINESMGHAAGDLALTQMAQRVRSAVDARDIVARHGSDEFTVLVQSLGDILHVESIARRILNNLSRPVPIGANSVYLGASVGIAIGSSGYERAEDVMRDAEIAMQHAKSTGGTRYALFDSNMHARAQQRLQLTTDLRLAIERHEFRLLYQPIVTLHDSRLVGCEALIRW